MTPEGSPFSGEKPNRPSRDTSTAFFLHTRRRRRTQARNRGPPPPRPPLECGRYGLLREKASTGRTGLSFIKPSFDDT